MTNPTPQAVGDSAASTLSVFGLFAMGFGQIVGVGWIIIMGSWLAAGGPVGTMSMLLLGGVLLLSVSLCYGWISQRVREPGGEIAYAKAVFGQRVAFIIGWFIALFAIAIVSFLTISFGWVTSILLGLPKGPVLYEVFGQSIDAYQFALSLIGLLTVSLINLLGIKNAGNFQNLATLFLIVAAFVMIGVSFSFGSISNIEPFFPPASDTSLVNGLVKVFITVPFFFAGFQIIPQLVEHMPKKSNVSLGLIMVVSVISAGLFYAGITLAVSLLAPWQNIIDAELPVYEAFSNMQFGEILGPVVLVAGTLGILTTWNSAFVWALKILSALAKDHMIPERFYSSPEKKAASVSSILLILVSGLAALFLGRSFILPIVNFAAASISLAMVCTTICVYILYKNEPVAEGLWGGMATIIFAIITAVSMFGLALYEPWKAAEGVPLEAVVFLIWTSLGVLLWWSRGKKISKAHRG